MDYASLRKLIRGLLDESSRQRRAAVRDTLRQAYASDPEGAPPTLSSGRVNKLAQIAQLGYELAGETAGSPPKYGFTMTSIQKVGINPASTFETPLALYAYPVDPVHIDQLLGGKFRDVGRQIPEIASAIPAGEGRTSLPFVATAPYINFFRINDTPGVYYTSVGMSEGQYKDAIDGLYAWFMDKSGTSDANKNFRSALVKAQQYNRVNSGSTIMPASALGDYGRLATVWSLSRALSLLKAEADFTKYQAAALGSEESETISQSNISMWRTLLLTAGIKAVVDDAGKGLIHRLEPFQMAVMDTTILEIIQQFDNVTPATTTREPAGKKQQDSVKHTTLFVNYVREELAKAKPNLQDVLHYVNTLTMNPGQARRQLKEAGIFDSLQEFVRNFIKSGDLNVVGNMTRLFSAYTLFGDVIISDILDRIAESSSPYADVGSMIQSRQTYTLVFALKLLKAFAVKYKSEIVEEQNFYVRLITDLAGAFSYEKILTPSAFIQEVMPIIKEMPDGKNTNISVKEGQVNLVDHIRQIFGEVERETQGVASRRKEDQFREKYTRKPRIDGILADDITGAPILKSALHFSRVARSRLKYAKDRFKDDVANKRATLLRARPDDFLVGTSFFSLSNYSHMLPDSGANAQIEDIYQRYKTEIQKACRTISNKELDAALISSGTDEEMIEKSKKLMKDYAEMQLQKIEAAIDTFEKEMTDFLTSYMPPGGDEPLHERLMRQWKLL